MSEIFLTDEQYARIPYKGTEVSKGKTLGQIIGLLEDHGITDYQWTKLQGMDQLAFPLKIRRADVDVGFLVKLTVPRLMYSLRVGRSRYGPKTMTYLENVSWRVFWWHLKSKLEAIEYGISDEAREFMYNIHYALPDGREVGLGEMILDNVQQLDKLGALEDRRIVKAEIKES